jgi:hypothetical protein
MSTKRFVCQQQRSEIMQCFAIFVNSLFASPQFPALASCQLNYLISLCFSLGAEAKANHNKGGAVTTRPF